MQRESSAKVIINLLIKINVALIIFLVPLFFTFFFKTNNVFELNKASLFKVLVLILFTLTFSKTFWVNNFNKFISLEKIRKSWFIIIPIFLYFFSLSISTLFSDYFAKSFFGSYERQLGFEIQIYFLLFFLLLLINIKTKNDIYVYLRALSLSVFFISLYAVLQAFGHDPFTWIESTKSRAISTLGQPNFLASFLLLTVPINLVLFYISSKENKSFVRKYIYLVFLLFGILALAYTYSFSAWLSLFMSLALFALIFIYYNFSKIAKKSNLKYLFLILFFISIAFLAVKDSNVFSSKFSSVFDLETGSTAARINYWQASWQAIEEKPFFGYGIDVQGEVLPRYYETDWALHSNVGVLPDRAHNLILDILLSSGFFGLLAYIFLLGLIFYLIIKNIKNNREKHLNIAIVFSLTAYLFSLFFNFSFIASETILWFYLAIIIKIYFLKSLNHEEHKTEIVGSVKKIIIFLVLIIISFFAFNIAKKEINKIVADKYYLDLRQSQLNNQFFEALVFYDYIEELEQERNPYAAKFGPLITGWTDEMKQYGLIYKAKGEEYAKISLTQLNFKTYEERQSGAIVFAGLSRGYDPEREKAEELFKELIKEYPGVPRNYYLLAKLYSENEESDLAIELARKALERIPQEDNPRLNPDHEKMVRQERYINYILLGDIFMEKNNFENAKKEYENAKEMIDTSQINKKLADVYKELGDIDTSIQYNKRAIEIDSHNHIWHYYLAKNYFETGDYENALISAEKALEIFPHHSESIKLKEELTKAKELK